MNKINYLFFVLFLIHNNSIISQSLNILNDLDIHSHETIQDDRCTNSALLGDFSPDAIAQFQSIINDLVITKNLIGISASVITDDGKVWNGVRGKSSDMTDDTIVSEMVFGMGSVTKTITSAAILQLMESNKLKLSNPISKYISTYNNIDPGISIKQLLQHTSGLYNITENPQFQSAVFLAGDKIWTPDEVLKNFVLKPNFQKGTSWSYSNTNYVILGMIIEKITGLSYHDYIKENIIAPSDLSTFSLYPHEELKGILPHLWSNLGGAGVEDVILKGLKLKGLFSAAWAAGAYTSTSEDIARWMSILQNSLFKESSTLDLMRETYVLNGNTGYGLGLVVIDLPNATFYGHGGDIGYSTQAYYSPQKGIAIVINTNDGSKGGSASLTSAVYDLYNAYCATITSSKNNANEIPFAIALHASNYETLAIESNEPISSLSIYNTLGQSIFYQKNINSQNFEFELPINNQALFIKFLSVNDHYITKKIMR